MSDGTIEKVSTPPAPTADALTGPEPVGARRRRERDPRKRSPERPERDDDATPPAGEADDGKGGKVDVRA